MSEREAACLTAETLTRAEVLARDVLIGLSPGRGALRDAWTVDQAKRNELEAFLDKHRERLIGLPVGDVFDLLRAAALEGRPARDALARLDVLHVIETLEGEAAGAMRRARYAEFVDELRHLAARAALSAALAALL